MFSLIIFEVSEHISCIELYHSASLRFMDSPNLLDLENSYGYSYSVKALCTRQVLGYFLPCNTIFLGLLVGS